MTNEKWVIKQLEKLHSGIAGCLAFNEKVNPIEAYSAFMTNLDQIIDNLYKRMGEKRKYYTFKLDGKSKK